MDTLKVKKTSWHYRLAKVYGKWDDKWWRTTNICAYSMRVLWGLIKAVALATVVGVVLSGIVDGIMGLVITGEPNVLGTITLGVLVMLIAIGLFCGIMAGGVGVVVLYTDYRRRKRYERDQFNLTPKKYFIIEAFRAWHNKVCFKVEAED